MEIVQQQVVLLELMLVMVVEMDIVEELGLDQQVCPQQVGVEEARELILEMLLPEGLLSI